jgi:dephospho-CoA kinase
MAELIAITGGIGCGKSIVSLILKEMGYEVYDCDCKAKYLMDNSPIIKDCLKSTFGNDIIIDGTINRVKLASIVFNNKEKLVKLNNIVHSSVKEDLISWKLENSHNKLLFVETAILYQSGLDKVVDEVWEVNAPIEIRVERVMKRNNISRQDVLSRIESQKYEILAQADYIIINDDKVAILPQLVTILGKKL